MEFEEYIFHSGSRMTRTGQNFYSIRKLYPRTSMNRHLQLAQHMLHLRIDRCYILNRIGMKLHYFTYE